MTGLEFLSSWGIVLIAVVFHEFAHAWMAEREGDPTPRFLGRLTLNPFSHLDPIGSFLLPLSLLVLGQGALPVIGWAKPVPINPLNMREGQKSAVKVALAGPLMNILLGFLSSFIFVAFFLFGHKPLSFFATFSFINFALALFNLLPFPPLDGSHFLFYFLSKDPEKLWKVQSFLAQWGLVLLVLFVFSPLSSLYLRSGSLLLSFLSTFLAERFLQFFVYLF